jgi:hypothetical protein
MSGVGTIDACWQFGNVKVVSRYSGGTPFMMEGRQKNTTEKIFRPGPVSLASRDWVVYRQGSALFICTDTPPVSIVGLHWQFDRLGL